MKTPPAFPCFSSRLAALVTLALWSSLTSCGSRRDPSEKNFTEVVARYLGQKGRLSIAVRSWPVDIDEVAVRFRDAQPTGLAAQMKALEAVGLVRSTVVQVDRKPDAIGAFFGGKTRHENVVRYDRTEAAQSQTQEGDLCYGQKTLDRVVKWEGPLKLGDYQEVKVWYTARLTRLADWTSRPEIKSAFPRIAGALKNAGQESTLRLKLTSEGWEPHEGLFSIADVGNL